MLRDLKEAVWKANLDLPKLGLVILNFGNVSGIDRRRGVVAIKPSGVAYETLKPEDIVLVDFEGRVVEGRLKPSSDTPTHVELYRAFPGIGGVVHAHSEWATAFAQARREIPCLGTTHADFFAGPVPITRELTPKEVRDDYEGNTGRVIVKRFGRLDPSKIPAVLVAGHGPFAWGTTPTDAVRAALALEWLAKTALATRRLNPRAAPLPAHILKKHFERKHGPQATYGQKKGENP